MLNLKKKKLIKENIRKSSAEPNPKRKSGMFNLKKNK